MIKAIALPFLLLFALVAAAMAEPPAFQVGERLPELVFTDQHENPAPITEEHRLLLFSKEMDSNDIIHGLMKEQGPEYLSNHQAAFTADISGMPGLITSLFALPKMRKYPYLMHLDFEGNLTERFPFEGTKITMIYLKKGQIVEIRYAKGLQEVKEGFERLNRENEQ